MQCGDCKAVVYVQIRKAINNLYAQIRLQSKNTLHASFVSIEISHISLSLSTPSFIGNYFFFISLFCDVFVPIIDALFIIFDPNTFENAFVYISITRWYFKLDKKMSHMFALCVHETVKSIKSIQSECSKPFSLPVQHS